MVENKYAAIVMAIGMNQLSTDGVDVKAKANQILALNPVNGQLSDEEFDRMYKSLPSAKINIGAEIKIKPQTKKLRYNGKNPHVLMGNVLGDQSIFLIQGQFRNEADKEFIIEFNVDGKGSSRLPNGKIVNCPLIDISREYAPAFGIPEVERNLNSQWKMSPRHHSEVANKGVKVYLQNLNDGMYD